jgi:hypothetical protein
MRVTNACVALGALLLANVGVRALDADLGVGGRAAPAPDAGLRLPTFIASHMVLQRFPARAALWGWANPGANVTVELIYDSVDAGTIRTGAGGDGGGDGGGAASTRTARRLRMKNVEPFSAAGSWQGG